MFTEKHSQSRWEAGKGQSCTHFVVHVIRAERANSNTFEDYVWQADDIGDFSAVAVKVVLLSSDSTQVPQCEDLRVIALGT